MSFAQIKAADAKCGNSTGGVFKDRRELVATVDELAGTLREIASGSPDECVCTSHVEAIDLARAALAKLEQQ